MGQILTPALLSQRAATEAAALALHNVPGYRPMHGRDGGEMAVMLDTLRGPVLGLSDTSALLPGHGPQSLMAAERSSNPYLQADYLGGIR